MALTAGSRLGPYEILSVLGTGGMGEVYKARDTRLDRTVAIKILSPPLATDPQFRERFDHEARTISQLDHPHICALYDVGEQAGTSYLVMQYLEGETLEHRLQKGALPLDQVMECAIQIADALDKAHRAGIVHRDLKPGNILLTRSGAKLLDFGLAKTATSAVAGANLSILPTTPPGLTAQGTILGTFQYMAPEQLEGREADSRSDIFAFGGVLYEMLTGNKAFDGRSHASLISSIMSSQPPPVSSLQMRSPAGLDRLLARCLAKDPEDRWQSARDLKAELVWIAETGPAGMVGSTRAPSPWRERTGWITAAGVSVALTLVLLGPWRGRSLPPSGVVRFDIYPPEGTVFTGSYYTTVQVPQFALSPDGRAVVFVAAPVGATPMLWLRSIEDVTARRLPGTEDAAGPFWSPDSHWVGFFADGKVKKIPAVGGAVQVVAEGALNAFGGTWNRDDTILFGYGNNPIRRVPATGEAAKPATNLDASRLEGEGGHRWPHFLPDGRHFLLTVRGNERRGVFVGSLDGLTKKFLVRVDSSAVYASPGYLLWIDGDALLGQPFDADRLELSRDPVTIAESVGRSSAGAGAVSASSTGVIAYARATLRHGRLTWFDRSGSPLDSISAEGDYSDFRLSPDGKRLAASLVDPKTDFPDIWLTDLEQSRPSRFTFGAFNASPVWSPDGTRLVFRTLRTGVLEFYEKSAFGAGTERTVLSVDAQRAAGVQGANLVPSDWSPDGRYIIYSDPETSGFDLWLFPLGGNAPPVKLLGTTADEIHANFSPDGRFLAYSSNESGRFEVYVQTFPLSDRKWQVSTNGGYEPRWRGDGREIYYLADDRKLMAASIAAGPSFDAPRPLFQTRVAQGVHPLRTNYVPNRDGQRFLVNTQNESMPAVPITIVLNWQEELKQRVPTR